MRLIITCAHVWQDFIKYRDTVAPNAVLATIFRKGPAPAIMLLPELLIDEGQSLLDIAVFRACPEKWDMAHKEFFRIREWPIPRVKPSDPISFLGFPGAFRDASPQRCFFNYSSFGLTVGGVSHYQFIISDRGTTFNDDGTVAQNVQSGGLSGSPVFLRSGGYFRFRGIVSAETSNGLLVTHGSFLQQNGTLIR